MTKTKKEQSLDVPGGTRQTLMLAVLSSGVMRVEVTQALHTALWPMGVGRWFRVYGGNSTGDGRNIAVADAIKKKVDIIMFWDDDVIPLDRLHAANLLFPMLQNAGIAAIGGVYPKKDKGAEEPIVFKVRGAPSWWGWQDQKVHRVYCTATGFTAFRVNDLLDLDVEEYRPKGQRRTVRRFFDAPGSIAKGASTDDFYIAAKLAAAKKAWYVNGAIVCDQIDLHGKKYRIMNGKTDFAEGEEPSNG